MFTRSGSTWGHWFVLRPEQTALTAGVATTYTLSLPRSALRGLALGARESVVLTLSATGPGGTGRATARARLTGMG